MLCFSSMVHFSASNLMVPVLLYWRLGLLETGWPECSANNVCGLQHGTDSIGTHSIYANVHGTCACTGSLSANNIGETLHSTGMAH